MRWTRSSVAFSSLALAAILSGFPLGNTFGQVGLSEDALSPELTELLRAKDPGRRRAGIDQLENQVPIAIATPLLLQKLTDEDSQVRARAAQALGRKQVVEAAPRLLERLSESETTVRTAAAEALGRLPALPEGLAPQVVATIGRTLGDVSFEVRQEVLRALEQMIRSRVLGKGELLQLIGPVVLRVDDENVVVRRVAVAVLGKLAEGEAKKQAIVPLLSRLQDNAAPVRAEALRALSGLAVSAAAPSALRLLSDPSKDVQVEAALCLGRLQAALAVPPLSEMLLRGLDPLRGAAATALGQIAAVEEGKEALPVLFRALGKPELQPIAREALLSLGPALVAPVLARLSRREFLESQEVGALLTLLRDTLSTEEARTKVSPALRKEAGAVVLAELSRGRLPKAEIVEVLGQIRAPETAAACVGLLGEPDVLLRRAAIRALRQPGLLDERALDALLSATRDKDPEVQQGAIQSVGDLGLLQATPRLSELVADRSLPARVRVLAAEAIGTIYKKGANAKMEARRPLLELLVRALLAAAPSGADKGDSEIPYEMEHGERRIRRAIALTLSQIAERLPDTIPQMVPLLSTPLKRGAIQPGGPLLEVVAALGGVLRGKPTEMGREVLLELAELRAPPHTPEASLAVEALFALCALQDPRTESRLLRLLGNPDPLRRKGAVAALGCLLPGSANATLVGAILSTLSSDGDARVRAEAAWALGRLPPRTSFSRKVVGALRDAQRRTANAIDPLERINLVAALVSQEAGEVQDALLLTDREPGVRANGALLLRTLIAKYPGLRTRLVSLASVDPSSFVRRSAARALASSQAGSEKERRSFLALYHVDLNQQPLSEVRYRLYLPDGVVRAGVADGRGVSREELIAAGPCEVELLEEGLPR